MNSGISPPSVTDIDKASLFTIQTFLGLSINEHPRSDSHPCPAFVPPGAFRLMVDLDPICPCQDDPPPALRKASKEVDPITRSKPIPLLDPSAHSEIGEIMEMNQIHKAFMKDDKKPMKRKSPVPGRIDGHVGFHGEHISRVIRLPTSEPYEPGFKYSKIPFECFKLVRRKEKLRALDDLLIGKEPAAETHLPHTMKAPRAR